jgi:hypothetical protein
MCGRAREQPSMGGRRRHSPPPVAAARNRSERQAEWVLPVPSSPEGAPLSGERFPPAASALAQAEQDDRCFVEGEERQRLE